MVEIKPFTGITYNPQQIKEIEKVIAPPYDVINPAQQEMFYQRDPHNIIRLILGKEGTGPKDSESLRTPRRDSGQDNKYTRAAETFRKWLSEGILVKANQPAVYAVREECEIQGKKQRRTGFIALLKVADYGNGVYPHEKTHNEAIVDRTLLLDACHASFDQIFMIYDDPSQRVDKILKPAMESPPLISLVDEEGVKHELWEVADQAPEICGLMRDTKAIIADGHHRYETARRYTQEPYTPVYFANTAGDFIVMPIYRLFHKVAKLDFSKVNDLFVLKECGSAKELLSELEKSKHSSAFGFLSQDSRALLTLKDRTTPLKLIKGDNPPEWKQLDVTVLHKLLLPKLGVSERDNISYTVKLEEAEEKLANGEAELAVLLNPTRVEQVEHIALSGNVMPQKSTFFYPKLLSGLVLREF